MKAHLYAFLFITSISQAQIIELPYTFHNGWGEYQGRSFGGMNFSKHAPESTWGIMEIETSGAPVGFSVQREDTDIIQFIWQSYVKGKVSKEVFLDYMESWEIDTLSENLTRDFIRCYVHVAIKKENDSTFLYIVDTNNDLDFSDEKIHSAAVRNPQKTDDLYQENVVKFTYDVSSGGNIQTRQGEILILADTTPGAYMPYLVTFPHHCASTLMHEGEEYAILFQYSSGGRLQAEKSVSIEHPIHKALFVRNQSLILGDYGYRIDGVNPSKQVLILEKYQLDPNEPLAQEGFFAPEIAGMEFTSGESLKLSDYRGKYVLLYVWATWCQPCYGSLPKLAAIRDSISEDDLQIFSAHYHSNAENLPSIIEQFNIHWPQLLHTQCSTNVEGDYTKRGVPFSALINPEGRIVEVGIHASPNLVRALKELISD
jgi:thiol-disulfide isomerase/thioredoxin